MGSKITKYFIIGTFVSLYVIVSLISTIHVIDFFEMSNPHWLAVSLAVAFEVGAAASLASIITLDKMNKTIVWVLFFVLTAMQAMGNAYYAYSHIHDYQSWVELFGLVDAEPIEQKRILAVISGAILPLVALGFIKSLVDYLRPTPAVDPDDAFVEKLEKMPDLNKVESTLPEGTIGVNDGKFRVMKGGGWKPFELYQVTGDTYDVRKREEVVEEPKVDWVEPPTQEMLDHGNAVAQAIADAKDPKHVGLKADWVEEKIQDLNTFPAEELTAKLEEELTKPEVQEEIVKLNESIHIKEQQRLKEEPKEVSQEPKSALDKIRVFKDGNK